jgi:[CysO sulfur-carrier protein]-S-L-cysteine hydrolase
LPDHGEEVRLTRAALEDMIDHCIEGRPNEACGMIAAKDGVAGRIIRIENEAQSPVRYRFETHDLLNAHRLLDTEGLDLAAVYHSHTRTEAYPSPTDVREAVEVVPYVIVSLADDPPTVRAFRILKEKLWDETGEVLEVPVVVLG